jgi:glutamate racemase
MNPNPIGIFDSGVGGLSVVVEIRRQLPGEDVIYYADTAFFPYGPKPAEEVRARALEVSSHLIESGAKLVVVACNTASAAALADLRRNLAVPIVGIVPAVKPAGQVTKSGKIAVIATEATVSADVFDELVDEFAEGVTVLRQACGGLVELVERGEVDSPEARELLKHYLDPLVSEGVDVLVLGCTHYPFLKTAMGKVVGDGVKIIDTGQAVARQVGRVLADNALASGRNDGGNLTILSSGDREVLFDVIRRLDPDKALGVNYELH